MCANAPVKNNVISSALYATKLSTYKSLHCDGNVLFVTRRYAPATMMPTIIIVIPTMTASTRSLSRRSLLNIYATNNCCVHRYILLSASSLAVTLFSSFISCLRNTLAFSFCASRRSRVCYAMRSSSSCVSGSSSSPFVTSSMKASSCAF